MTRPPAAEGAARRALALVPLGPPFPDPDLAAWLARELGRVLRLDARLDAPAPLPGPPGRAAASADAVVDALAERRPPIGDHPPALWTLGLTDADLHAPGRTFVFGEAALGGAWAVVSAARLRPADPFLDHELLRERLVKEALHEIGHLAGLPECAHARCVMTPSPSVTEVDAKGEAFCAACGDRLAALDPPLV